MDSRAVSPVVEKLLALGLVVVYVGLLTTTLYGGAVPTYRAAVGSELGERTLAEATARVEQAVPPAARAGSARYRVDLPATIGGAAYEIRTDGRELVLVHPDPAVGGRARPVLPDRVDALIGTWESGSETAVRVTGSADGTTVELEDG